MLLPMIKVVHPAYHCFPNGGKGSFCPAARREFNCVRVLANSAGYVMAISTAPAVLPAMIERNGDGLIFFGSSDCVEVPWFAAEGILPDGLAVVDILPLALISVANCGPFTRKVERVWVTTFNNRISRI
jgi:hypothetical protein